MTKRQQFLTEQRYDNFLDNYKESFIFWQDKLFQADSPEQEKSLRARHFQTLYLNNILMRYTAGEEIFNLPPLLEELVDSYEVLQQKLAQYEQIENITPLTIDDWIDEYQECLQVISLCILLHRRDLLKRFVLLIDNAGYAGTDTLYEDLLIKILPDREDIDQWYHDAYTPLIQAIYVEDKNNAPELLKNTVKIGIRPLIKPLGMIRTRMATKAVTLATGRWKREPLRFCTTSTTATLTLWCIQKRWLNSPETTSPYRVASP